MIDVCANPPQAEVSRNTGQDAPQHAKNVTAHSPSAETVRRFEQACEKCDIDDEMRTADTSDMGDDSAASGSSAASTAGMSGSVYSAHRDLNFAHAHETASREARVTADQKKEEQRRTEDGSAHNPLGMTHPLDGMFMAAPATSAAEGDAPLLIDDASAVWGKLAERILVAEAPHGGQEVRITVGQDILPGTEISLSRHPGGGLTAILITNNASTLQTLVAGRDGLRQRLENMGETNVQVDVHTSTDGDGGDMRQRSRGLLYPDPEAEG